MVDPIYLQGLPPPGAGFLGFLPSTVSNVDPHVFNFDVLRRGVFF